MKSSSIIADKVFLSSLKYVKLQNKTKELFFKCLDERRSLDYFKKEVMKIWGNVDHSYMWQELDKFEEIIHNQNIQDKETLRVAQEGDIFELVPDAVITKYEREFAQKKIKEYSNSLKSYGYKTDKDNYLKIKVNKYTNQTVPYYPHTIGDKIKYVELSTYTSMIYNTNLIRSVWNQTWKDAIEIGQDLFWIPYHPFSCPHCIQFQNRVLTKKEVLSIAGRAEESSGDLLHPNCKCELMFYIPGVSRFNRPNYSTYELEEQYHTRQKVNSLTLKKEKLKTDIRIQKDLGNEDEIDSLNSKRNKINKEIRKLQEALPTNQLKKMVVPINR